ncbi:MAG: ACP synthase, partial [Candidatus Thermoplasmatota archaeon]|nr:ACP synthase [Candidatus Thermoplasmatota archaeon]
LGGICTVMVETLDGPNGVFLLVDDQNLTPQIDDSVELVVRRLYAQEGVIRYGAKAIISDL